MEVLESNWSRFQTEHDNICQLNLENFEEIYFRTKTYEQCQQFYIQVRSTLLNCQESLEDFHPPSRSADTLMANSTFTNYRHTLARITLPQFTGNYHSWRSFYNIFSSMVIHNQELSEVERMHYLKNCLSGEATRLIESLPVSGDTFSIAWNTLINGYENKRILISTHLDKILNLKRSHHEISVNYWLISLNSSTPFEP